MWGQKRTGALMDDLSQSGAAMNDTVEYSVPFGQYPSWMANEASPNAALVYMALGTFAFAPKRTCYPSIRKLAEITRISESTVRRAIRELQDIGAVTVESQFLQGKEQTSNKYILNVGERGGVMGDSTPPVTGDTTPLSRVTPKEEELKEEKTFVSEEAKDVAELLASLLAKNYELEGKKVPRLSVQSWIPDIEKLNRIDGADWDEIRRVVEWCQSDSFWRYNIMSGSKLRKQYPQLLAKMPSRPSSVLPEIW